MLFKNIEVKYAKYLIQLNNKLNSYRLTENTLIVILFHLLSAIFSVLLQSK